MADYSMWLLEYAHCPTQSVGSILAGWHNQGETLLTYTYMVLKGENHNIMIDVGYDNSGYGKELADRSQAIHWQSPEHVLSKIGMKPEDIDTVFITHAHYDHMGNLEAFPNAHFYLQKRELSEWIWALSLPERFKFLTQAIDPDDIVEAVKLVTKRKFTLIDGPENDILPGIHVLPMYDSHTFGSQFVLVDIKTGDGKGTWVVVGDCAYKKLNLQGVNKSGNYIPIGLGTGSQVNMMMSLEKMVKLSGSDLNKVVIGHDPENWEIYPSWQTDDGLWVAELNLAPGEPSRRPV